MAGKVLIADDSLKIQEQLIALLKEADIEAVAVSNGEYAVRKLPDVKPDLVLADIFMPVRTGYEVCEYVKQSEEFSQVPVLLLASTLEPYDAAEAKRVKADGKIDKPFSDPQATLAAIKERLDAYLAQKPPEPVISEDEFAAIPVAEEPATETAPEPEPEPAEEMAATPPPVQFEPSDQPMSFTDMLGEDAAVEPPSAPAVPPPAEALPTEEPAAPAPEPAPVESAPTKPELEGPTPEPSGQEEREIGQPELAAPWEMTAPPAGAPEIPTPGSWDSQDWEAPEANATAEESLAEEPAATETPATEETPTAVEAASSPAAEEPSPEAQPVQPFPPKEFAAAFTSTPTEEVTADATPPEAAAPPEATAEPEPSVPAEAAPTLDQAQLDALVEQLTTQVVEKLAPQITDALALEIRPLAEQLLKEKLNQ